MKNVLFDINEIEIIEENIRKDIENLNNNNSCHKTNLFSLNTIQYFRHSDSELINYIFFSTNNSQRKRIICFELMKLLSNENDFQNYLQDTLQPYEKGLKSLMMDYNILCNWQFNGEQKKLLEKYYDANLLLVTLMDTIELATEVRQEIEDALLLPINLS